MYSQLIPSLSRCRLVEMIPASIIDRLINLVHHVIDGNLERADPRSKIVVAELYYVI